MNIAALVSGGVDSSVMLHLLKEQGFEPTIFYIQISADENNFFADCSTEEDLEIIHWLAKYYGLKFEIAPLHKEYWENVVKYTVDAVKQGLTPNPDVMCNRLIKFGEFENHWGKSFDAIATGHYANTLINNDIKYLTTAKDKFKDQTDFLAQITYNQLLKLIFPLGNLLKSEVREIANKIGMPSATRRDSQGICFLGKINYNDFIKKYLGEKNGDIIEFETMKKIGTHKGYWFHTIGQRKGLNLSGGPWFVIDKDIENNIIYVSHGYDPLSQYKSKINLYNLHYISPKPNDISEITFKIRHTPDFSKGKLIETEEVAYIQSEEPIAGVAPGQFGVIYDKTAEICLGSGIISV